jgi:dolichyl-phosphate beta-glucosyltransferase
MENLMANTISLIIPVYNEEEILERQIEKLLPFMDKNFTEYEIILSENGSTDQTKNISRDLEKKFESIKALIDDVPGDYGLALKKGISLARFEQIGILELDYLDTKYLLEAYKMIHDYDLIIGSKSLSVGIDERPLKRKIMSWLYNLVIKMIFKVNLTETHGSKVFKKKKLEGISNECITTQGIWPTEFVLRAHLHPELKVKEIPINLAIIELRPTRIGALKRLKKTYQDLMLLKSALKKNPYLQKTAV